MIDEIISPYLVANSKMLCRRCNRQKSKKKVRRMRRNKIYFQLEMDDETKTDWAHGIHQAQYDKLFGNGTGIFW